MSKTIIKQRRNKPKIMKYLGYWKLLQVMFPCQKDMKLISRVWPCLHEPTVLMKPVPCTTLLPDLCTSQEIATYVDQTLKN